MIILPVRFLSHQEVSGFSHRRKQKKTERFPFSENAPFDA